MTICQESPHPGSGAVMQAGSCHDHSCWPPALVRAISDSTECSLFHLQSFKKCFELFRDPKALIASIPGRPASAKLASVRGEQRCACVGSAGYVCLLLGSLHLPQNHKQGPVLETLKGRFSACSSGLSS